MGQKSPKINVRVLNGGTRRACSLDRELTLRASRSPTGAGERTGHEGPDGTPALLHPGSVRGPPPPSLWQPSPLRRPGETGLPLVFSELPALPAPPPGLSSRVSVATAVRLPGWAASLSAGPRSSVSQGSTLRPGHSTHPQNGPLCEQGGERGRASRVTSVTGTTYR